MTARPSPGDREREAEIRAMGLHESDDCIPLLRLLDAERARAARLEDENARVEAMLGNAEREVIATKKKWDAAEARADRMAAALLGLIPSAAFSIGEIPDPIPTIHTTRAAINRARAALATGDEP